MLRRLAIVAVACVALSCSPRPIGAVVADAPRAEWQVGEGVELRYEHGDTLNLRSVGVVARWEIGCAKRELPLRITAQSPLGVRYDGEVVLLPTERHKGGSFVEFATEWIDGALLGESGEYVFTLSPTATQRGVWTVGVKIENNEK